MTSRFPTPFATLMRASLFTLLLLIVSLLLLSSCGGEQVVTSAELAIDAAEAALPAISTAAGLPAATQTQILDYLTAASTGLSQSAAVISKGGSAASVAAQIVSIFAGVSAPALPAGTPANVAAAVQAVSTAVGQFVTQFAAAAPAAPPGAQQFFASGAGKPPHVKLSKKLKARVDAVKTRAEALKLKIEALRK